MPPFPSYHSLTSVGPPQQLEPRSTSSNIDTHRLASSMAHAILHSRSSSDTLSPALEPLEPLSTLEESSNREIHFPSSFSKRETSGLLDVSVHQLTPRDLRTNVIPLSYNLSGAKPGVVVGATLGAIIGFIFITWLVWFLTTFGGTGAIEGSDITDVHVTRHTRGAPRSAPRSRYTRRTRTHRSEMSERSSPPAPRRRERILVEETRRTERSRPPPPPMPREEPPSPEIEREHIEVEERDAERRVEGDDMVEVIEEQSDITPQPAPKRNSGYRTVDPDQYGGGNFEQHDLHERDRRRSRHR